MDCVLILSHGNADPKSGFSVSDRLLNYHGSKTSGETSEALRFVKNLLNRKGGVEGIKFRQGLSKRSFIVQIGASRKEKARIGRSCHKSSGARKETGQT